MAFSGHVARMDTQEMHNLHFSMKIRREKSFWMIKPYMGWWYKIKRKKHSLCRLDGGSCNLPWKVSSVSTRLHSATFQKKTISKIIGMGAVVYLSILYQYLYAGTQKYHTCLSLDRQLMYSWINRDYFSAAAQFVCGLDPTTTANDPWIVPNGAFSKSYPQLQIIEFWSLTVRFVRRNRLREQGMWSRTWRKPLPLVAFFDRLVGKHDLSPENSDKFFLRNTCIYQKVHMALLG
jgi:hypothetical protein